MNGVHDLGGMHGMGALTIASSEPVFAANWEARVFALRRAMGAFRRWNIDMSRYAIERLPASDYLRLGYYERQFEAFLQMLVRADLLTNEEIVSGHPAPGTPRATPALTVGKARALIAQGVPTNRAAGAPPRFQVGQRVRARNMHPAGHTRLPRYARGKLGSIDRDHGVFVFPDSNAQLRGESPQHVYGVRFAARELWGDAAAAEDSVYVDLWDDYLEAL